MKILSFQSIQNWKFRQKAVSANSIVATITIIAFKCNEINPAAELITLNNTLVCICSWKTFYTLMLNTSAASDMLSCCSFVTEWPAMGVHTSLRLYHLHVYSKSAFQKSFLWLPKHSNRDMLPSTECIEG